MSNITPVYYKEIEPEVLDLHKAAEYYFLYNLLEVSDEIRDEYEEYEYEQINLRNKIIGNALNNKEIPNTIKANTSIFGISSLNNKPAICVEY